MLRRSTAVRVGKYVAAVALLCLVPAAYIGQNASNGIQVSGPTDILLKTAALKTTLNAGLTGGTLASVTVAAAVVVPGFNIVLDRGMSSQETDLPFTQSGMPTGTCSSSGSPSAGTWCLQTDAQDTLRIKPMNNHSSGAAVEQLGSVLIQFLAGGTTTTIVQVDPTTGSITTNGKLIFNNNSTGTASTALTSSPSGLNTWTFQNATDTVVGLNTTDTLSNKTLTSPTAQASSSGQVPLTVKGASGQSVDLERWQNSSGTTLARVTKSGAAQFGYSATTGSGGRVMLDASAANTFKLGLTGDVTGSSLTNPTTGQILHFVICEPSTAHSLAWPSNFKGAAISEAASAPSPTPVTPRASCTTARTSTPWAPSWQTSEVMRLGIALNGSFFNTQRMLQHYMANAYYWKEPSGGP